MQRINRRMRADMTPEQFEVFRTTMRKLRKANKLTVQSLGDIINATPSHLSNIELGRKYPSNELARDIAEVFDTTVDEMCGGERKADPEITKRIGKAYLEKRIAKGFKMNEVAGFLEIPTEVYREFENGKSTLGESRLEALNRLYKVEKQVETVEVIKEVPVESAISLDMIDKILSYITDMNISKEEQIKLFRELSTARTQLIEKQLFGQN